MPATNAEMNSKTRRRTAGAAKEFKEKPVVANEPNDGLQAKMFSSDVFTLRDTWLLDLHGATRKCPQFGAWVEKEIQNALANRQHSLDARLSVESLVKKFMEEKRKEFAAVQATVRRLEFNTTRTDLLKRHAALQAAMAAQKKEVADFVAELRNTPPECVLLSPKEMQIRMIRKFGRSCSGRYPSDEQHRLLAQKFGIDLFKLEADLENLAVARKRMRKLVDLFGTPRSGLKRSLSF